MNDTWLSSSLHMHVHTHTNSHIYIHTVTYNTEFQPPDPAVVPSFWFLLLLFALEPALRGPRCLVHVFPSQPPLASGKVQKASAGGCAVPHLSFSWLCSSPGTYSRLGPSWMATCTCGRERVCYCVGFCCSGIFKLTVEWQPYRPKEPQEHMVQDRPERMVMHDCLLIELLESLCLENML